MQNKQWENIIKMRKVVPVFVFFAIFISISLAFNGNGRTTEDKNEVQQHQHPMQRTQFSWNRVHHVHLNGMALVPYMHAILITLKTTANRKNNEN